MTCEQKQTLKEFDAQQEKLERQLKALLERRREYINVNQLNKKKELLEEKNRIYNELDLK